MNGESPIITPDKPLEDKPACKNWTTTEIILIIAVIGMGGYLLNLKLNFDTPELTPVECSDAGCYKSVTEINNYIDPSINPCDNFHEFACGNFLKNAYSKQVEAQIFEEEKKLRYELKAMVVEPITESDSLQIEIQKIFFQACTNLQDIREDNDQSFLALLEEIGGWPLLEEEQWKAENFDWVEAIIRSKNLGLPFQWFVQFGLHSEDGRNYLKISYPTIDNTYNSTNQKNYEANVYASLVGKHVNLTQIFDFENKLVDLIKTVKKDLVILSVSDLQRMHPKLDWLLILANLTQEAFEIDVETEVATNVEEYIPKLYALLTSTPKRIQANYIAWKMVEDFAPYIASGIRNSKKNNRLDFCLEKTQEKFPYFSIIEYIKKYSPEETRTSAKEVASIVQTIFLRRVEEATWWNETIGHYFLEKFQSTTIDIGSQDEIFDDDFLEANYFHINGLYFDTKSITEVITRTSKSYFNSIFSYINSTSADIEEKLLLLELANMNIVYNTALNRMTVPPALLHGFIFDNTRPKFLNFASLGSLLAKAFVKTLREESGKNRHYQTNAAFDSSKRCFEDDYNSIVLEKEFSNNTSEVIDEITADIIGRDIAYSAYQEWVKINGEEPGLSLLPYSPNQLFWIKSSLINCYKQLSDESAYQSMMAKYKNIIPLRHSPHFSSDFTCPENTAMNPTKKC